MARTPKYKQKRKYRYGNRTQVKYSKGRRKTNYAKKYKSFKKKYPMYKRFYKPYYKRRNNYKSFYDYLNKQTEDYYAKLRMNRDAMPTFAAAISGITRADDTDELSFTDDEAVRKYPRTEYESNALEAMMRATDHEMGIRAIEARNDREAMYNGDLDDSHISGEYY